MSSLFYFFKESLTGFSRNLSTTLGSIITIFLSLLIIGVFLVGGGIVDNIVNSVEDKVSVTAYVSDDANQNDINAVMKTIEGISGVQSVGFTTKDEAMENFSNSMSSNPEIVEQLDGMNPLPASIDIELSDAQQVECVVGAGLAIVFLEILRRVALPQVSTALMWLPIALSSATYARIYLTLVVAGLIIAAVGSMFAMRRYLKV